MRIAILGSVALPVPPSAQGGTEWIAYYQAKGLGSLGHKVILFAAKRSQKGAYELIEVGGGDMFKEAGDASEGLPDGASPSLSPNDSWSDFEAKSGIRKRQDPRKVIVESSRKLRQENVYLAQVIQKLIDRRNDYDLILNNMRGEAVFLPVAKMLNKPLVNVMHLPIFPELALLFKQYNTHIITISNAQRKDFPDLNYLATIYNCVDTEKYVFEGVAGDYLLMMGSIAPHKNQAAAIRVAKKLGMKLVLAGKVGNQDYFNSIKSDIDGEQIKWIGELAFPEKLKLYQKAKAFIFPINWPEPFGLVMIEAMAVGTPVVAFANGAIPEVLVDGKTGFVIEDNRQQTTDNRQQLTIKTLGEEGLVEAVRKITYMNEGEYQMLRQNCRKHVEENFTVEKMVKNYEEALIQIT